MRFDLRTRQHAQDEQHAACAGGAGFDDLVGVDEEVLAHGRHAQRRERCGGEAQVLHRAVEARGLGEHGDRGGARGCVAA